MSNGSSETKGQSRARSRRGGLGRGLESLIPTTSPTSQPAQDADLPSGVPLEVSIEAISPNPWQPRSRMDPHDLEELAQSIRTHGVMQPLVVTSSDEAGKYTLIAGERRWRASGIGGLKHVPIVVKDVTPQAMLELAIV